MRTRIRSAMKPATVQARCVQTPDCSARHTTYPRTVELCSQVGTSGTRTVHPEQRKGRTNMAETATEVREQAQEKVQQAGEQVQQAASKATDQARTQVDQRSTEYGERVTSTADDIRSVGQHLREQGKDQPARVADQAAQHVERLGGWLRDSDSDRLLSDIEDFGRRQPWAFALGGLALGIAASRFLKASSTQRYQQRQSLNTPTPQGSSFGSNGVGTTPNGEGVPFTGNPAPGYGTGATPPVEGR